MKVSTSTIGTRWHRPCPHCEGSFSRGQRFASCTHCDTAHHVRCAREAQTCKAEDCEPLEKNQDPRVDSSRLRSIRREIRKDETKRLNRREAFPGACERVKTRAQALRSWSAHSGARGVIGCLIWAVIAVVLEVIPSLAHNPSRDEVVGVGLFVAAAALLAWIYTGLNRGNPDLEA
jgi:hypothetical protein